MKRKKEWTRLAINSGDPCVLYQGGCVEQQHGIQYSEIPGAKRVITSPKGVTNVCKHEIEHYLNQVFIRLVHEAKIQKLRTKSAVLSPILQNDNKEDTPRIYRSHARASEFKRPRTLQR